MSLAFLLSPGHDPRVTTHPGYDGKQEVVRPAIADDAEQIRALALDNGMFAPEEMAGFDEGIRLYLSGAADDQRWIVVSSAAGVLAGAAYFAPEPFGDRVWNLYFLAVHPAGHRHGTGSTLIDHVQQALRAEGGDVARVLVVETSSTEQYEAARRFYVRQGFDREAVVREFYGPGDDKIIFWKSLLQ